MAIDEKKVNSLAEYLNTIKELSALSSVLWFRGHASIEYKLAPSIFRDTYSAKEEAEFMNLFKAKGVKFFPDKKDYFEWLFLMQHYGTPTRLLDWSENAMVAIAFATQYRQEHHKGKDAVVWCLNPFILNEQAGITSANEKIINICSNSIVAKFYESGGGSYPIAILGSYASERIIAQKGVFTLFPMTNSFYMEDLSNAEGFLTKIIIPEVHVNEIAEELYFIGVNELSLFPEPESVSKEIKRYKSLK